MLIGLGLWWVLGLGLGFGIGNLIRGAAGAHISMTSYACASAVASRMSLVLFHD